MRKHLEKYGIRFAVVDSKLGFKGRVLAEEEKVEAHLAIYRDPEIRPIFDQLGLAVVTEEVLE